MKGIVLAGGAGERLYPITKAVSKQLMAIYDKPMIYYPLSVLMMAGIREVMIVSMPRDRKAFQRLFGNGEQLGMSISYAVQEEPRGIAEAFLIAEDFIAGEDVALVLGDNIFYGQDFPRILKEAKDDLDGGMIFGYYVKNPQDYGVIEFDEEGKVLSIEEKPEHPKSNYVVPGLYFYDNEVVEIAKGIKPSARGELEITDINNQYLERGKLKVRALGRGFAWLDTGTPEALLDASNFVATFQKRQGRYVSCIEEIAYKQGFINREKLEKLAMKRMKTAYGEYLMDMAKREEGNRKWDI